MARTEKAHPVLWSLAAAAVALLIGSGVAAADSDREAKRWETCWKTANGSCKYECNTPDPAECPCFIRDDCPGEAT